MIIVHWLFRCNVFFFPHIVSTAILLKLYQVYADCLGISKQPEKPCNPSPLHVLVGTFHLHFMFQRIFWWWHLIPQICFFSFFIIYSIMLLAFTLLFMTGGFMHNMCAASFTRFIFKWFFFILISFHRNWRAFSHCTHDQPQLILIFWTE